jgi:RND superfamily putative drug exporter
MFIRLGSWCHDRRKAVVGIWLIAVVVLGGILGAVGTNAQSKFSAPPGESKRGSELLSQYFGGQGAGLGGRLVFESNRGFDDPAVRKPLATFVEQVAAIVPKGGKRGDVAVTSPFSPTGARQIAAVGALKGKVAYAEVQLPAGSSVEKAAAIRDQVAKIEPKVEGVSTYLGGNAFAKQSAPSSESLGLAFAIVILLLAFGSVLAMGLPVGVALGGIAGGSIIAGLLSHLIVPPDFASVLGVMIGLGVGIDYALFIVTRYREQLHAGNSVRDSTIAAIDTAGRAVLFAGTTVVISLLGMLIMQLQFITGLAIAAATVVAVTMVASVTLLPALLGFAGEKVEVTRWRGLIGAGVVALALVVSGLNLVAPKIVLPIAAVMVILLIALSYAIAPLKREVPRRKPKARKETFAYRWSRLIQHHPWPAVLGAVLLLLILAAPVLRLRLGFSDEGNAPKNTDTRQAYDLLSKGFGPGFNGPLIVATKVPAGRRRRTSWPSPRRSAAIPEWPSPRRRSRRS